VKGAIAARLKKTEVAPLRLLEGRAALPAAQRGDRVAGEGAEENEVESDRDEHGQQRKRDALHDVVGASHFSSLPLLSACSAQG